MKATTFVRPLIKKSTSHAPNIVLNHKEVGDVYRQRLGGNPFGIKRTSEEGNGKAV